MINGSCLKNAIISGANNISKYKDFVDKLNVFPVPDGDTGTNMSMTISTAIPVLEESSSELAGEVASIVSSALLLGGRGNSGVILSLLFRGFSKGLEGLEKIDAYSLVKALGIGVDEAYSAVMKPMEGTILTVARIAYESGKIAFESSNDPVFIWSEICEGAREALSTTPDLLPVLKKAGVVDAGGKGLCLIFDGMLSVFKDGVVIENDSSELLEQEAFDSDFFKNAAAEFDNDINFTYCTEFIVGREPGKHKEPDDFRKYLYSIGDSVVLVYDDSIIKVHIHTEEPGNAIQRALEFGQLLKVKIENMKEQHRLAEEKEKKASSSEIKPKLKSLEPTEEIGFVSVAAGDGLKDLFSDLGCANVISGGQTMNPSTDDILEAVLATPAKTVIVLPNNKNIIMSAEQTIPLAKDRNVVVLPTRTIPQGLTAMLEYDPDLTVEENISAMSEAISAVKTGLVTFAARDSEYSGFKIKKDDILAFENGIPMFTERDPIKAAIKLTRSMMKKDTEFVTLIYGKDINDESADEVYRAVRSKLNPNIDINVVNGGQPVYYFMISVE